jgi:hypothetical protein
MTPLVLAAFLAVVADPSAAQTANGQPAPPKGQATSPNKDPNKMVCRSEEQVGSNIRVRKCMTQAQWEEQEQEVRQYFEDAQSRGGINGGPPANPMAAGH